jgi:naphtho-gamma-pyrone polyketide synthase
MKTRSTAGKIFQSVMSEPAAPVPVFAIGGQSVAGQALKIIVEEMKYHISEVVEPISLSDMGVDSPMALSISGRFREELGFDISSGIFNDLDTVGDLKKISASG